MSRWKSVLLSLFAVAMLGAVASGSASAEEFYNENGELITGELSVVGLGGLQRFRAEVAGVKIEIHCTHLSGGGKILNGSKEGGPVMGLGEEGLLHYAGCTITAPKPKNVEGCDVPNGEIVVHGKALAIEKGGEPWIELTPPAGTTIFTTIIFEKCANSGLNGSHDVTGVLRCKVNNATSECEGNTGAGELEFAGNPATYTGNAVGEMEGGGKIEVR